MSLQRLSGSTGVLPLLAFLSLGIIWGSNFIYMKMAVELVSPSQVVLIRVVTGFIPVLTYALFTNAFAKHHLRYIVHFLAMSLLATVIYYYGFVKATQYLPSGIAGAVSAAIPLFSFLFALTFLPEEKLTTRKLSGIVLGFAGVLLIADPFAEGEAFITNGKGVAWILIGALCVGGSFVYAKKYLVPLKITSAALTSYQLGLASVILLSLTDFDGISEIYSDNHVFWGAIIGLGILGTGIAYLLYYYIVDKLGAVRAASATYLPPVVALIIGSVLVGEPISSLDYLGATGIVLGVYLLNKKVPKQKARLK